MHVEIQSRRSADGLRVGVAVSGYHADITASMKEGAVRSFAEAGGRDDDLTVVAVPGAFELPAVCRALAARGADAVVALGCVIAGETEHDRYLAAAVAHGLTMISVETGVPATFGVLTCRTMDQARARAGGRLGNKGAEAMIAAIEAAGAIRDLTAAAPGARGRN